MCLGSMAVELVGLVLGSWHGDIRVSACPPRRGCDCRVLRMWNSSSGLAGWWFVGKMPAEDTGVAMELTVPGVLGWEMGALESAHLPVFVPIS